MTSSTFEIDVTDTSPDNPVALERGPRHGDCFVLDVDSLTYKGIGVATLHTLLGPQRAPRTYSVKIRKALPGDRVRAVVEKSRKSELTCHIDAIVETSPQRTEPRCQHFGRREVDNEGCGGCALQMITYEDQLEFKQDVVRRFVTQAGVSPALIKKIRRLPEPLYYRNKMEFSFGNNPTHDFALGLHPLGYRHDVLALQECFLESRFVSSFLPQVSAALQAIGVEAHTNRNEEGFLKTLTIREGKNTGERMIEVTTTSAPKARLNGVMQPAPAVAQAVCEVIVEVAEEVEAKPDTLYWTQHHVKRGEPTRHIEHHVAGNEVLREQMHLPGEQVLKFEIHPRAFFQPNTRQAEHLYAHVLEYADLLGDDSERPKTVLDLYCGTGTIALCMAPYAEQVVGIELREEAVENARDNAKINAIDSATFFAGDVGEVLATDAFAEVMGDEVEVVVVDPPRAGLFPAAREQLEAIAPACLVYVSCNPKALGRDLEDLQARGFSVEAVQPVDMFPHTYHVETVVKLSR